MPPVASSVHGSVPFSSGTSARPAVLIVDDHAANLVAFEAVLAPLQAEIKCDLLRALSADQALRHVLAEGDRIAVVLLDVMMPGTDGLETARLIRQRTASDHVPIIFVTALDEDRRRITLGYQSGAVDYLTKPVDPDVMRGKVRAFVELHRRRTDDALRQRRRFADEVDRTRAETARLAEEAELQFQTQLRTLADVIPQLTWIAGADGEVVWSNRRFYDFTGLEPATIDGRGWVDVCDPESAPTVVSHWRRSIETGTPFEMEFQLRAADGSLRWFLTRAESVRDADGCVMRWFGTSTDVQAQREAATERERLQRLAEEAREVAESASRAKSEFLATMSHEIRTPINAIVGYTQLLELGIPDPATPAQREQLARVAASARHLLGLVNDILDVAKVDAGEMHVASEDATTGAAVHASLALARPLADQRGVILVDGGPDDAGIAYVGDDARVRQIVINLLSNAVKFTETSGTVSVSSRVETRKSRATRLDGDGPWTVVTVSDTGCGIAADQLDDIFEPFHQVEGGHTRRSGGTGLGLTISRRLARLMGGDLTVESTIGVGSTFMLWLPSARSATNTVSARATRRVDRSLGASEGWRVAHLESIGAAMREVTSATLAAYTTALREDAATPLARTMSAVEIEDHAATLLADMAQSLVMIAQGDGDAPALIRDSTAIQRTVAEHHGARRFAQGWTEGGTRRDYVVLVDLLERRVRERVAAQAVVPPAAVGEGVRVLRQLFERAAESSLAAFRHARATQRQRALPAAAPRG